MGPAEFPNYSRLCIIFSKIKNKWGHASWHILPQPQWSQNFNYYYYKWTLTMPRHLSNLYPVPWAQDSKSNDPSSTSTQVPPKYLKPNMSKSCSYCQMTSLSSQILTPGSPGVACHFHSWCPSSQQFLLKSLFIDSHVPPTSKHHLNSSPPIPWATDHLVVISHKSLVTRLYLPPQLISTSHELIRYIK